MCKQAESKQAESLRAIAQGNALVLELTPTPLFIGRNATNKEGG